MKPVFSILISIIAITTTSVFATISPEPGQYSIKGEWVYLQPALDSPFYVVDSVNPFFPDGDRNANEIGFHSGYRIEGMYAFNNKCNSFRIAWTNLSASASETVTNPSNALFLTIGAPSPDFSVSFGDLVSIDSHFDYYQLEVLFGHNAFNHYGLNLTLEGGVKLARVNFKQTAHLRDGGAGPDFADIDSKSTFWGIGPQIGLDFTYDLCNSFVITGNANAAILVSKNQADWFSFYHSEAPLPPPSVTTDIHNEKIWRMIPSSEMRLGINQRYRFCRMNWNVEAGYHFIFYYRAIDSVRLLDSDLQAGSIDDYGNAAMHGPYISLTLKF